MARLIAAALAQPLLTVLLALGLAGSGIWACLHLPVDAYPDIAPTQVQLILKAPGMTPEEVENRLALPLEAELLGIPHATVLRTTVKYALVVITLNFAEGTDIYWARQQVSERYGQAASSLPADVSGGLAPISTPLSDMYMFTLEGGGLSLAQRRTLFDWTIRPALRTVPGVADLNVLGGEVRAWQVTPDRRRLSALGLGFEDLLRALQRNNRNDGSGRLSVGDDSLVVRVIGAVGGAADIAAQVVTVRHGVPVRVGDVAEVGEGSLVRYGAVTRDGEGEAVEGLVVGLRGADASQVVSGVRQRLEQLKSQLPPGVHYAVFYDRSALIHRAVGTVRESLFEACLLVVVLLLLFLGDLRAAIVVSVTLPMAALMTFACMRVAGLSANLMSLGGLSIAIGMLVDGAVVVVENAVGWLSRPAVASGADRRERIGFAASEVAVPVTAGVLIIGLVFTPLLSLQGLEGRLFTPVALTIVFALVCALLLSLTLVPVLCSLLLRTGPAHEPWLMRKAERLYRPLLDWTLDHGRLMAGVAAGLLLLAVIAYASTGKTFMPTMDEGDMLLQLVKPPSVNLVTSRNEDLALERAIRRRLPEVQHVIARLGSDELGLDPMGLNETDMFLQLKPRAQWRVPSTEWLQHELTQVMEGFPGIQYSFSQPIQMRIDDMLSGSRGDVAVKIYGPDLETLNGLAVHLAQILERISGSREVIAQGVNKIRYLSVKLDPVAIGRQGLDVDAVEDELRAQLEGLQAGIVMEQQRRIPIVLRGDQTTANDVERFAGISLASAGGSVPLSQLARLENRMGPAQIYRDNGSRYALVQTNVRGRDLVGFVQEAQAAVARGHLLPPGYAITWGGEFENQQRAAARLAAVVPIALGLILLVLYFTFGRWREALLIIGNVPFALVGGAISLRLSGQYMSVPASVGFIALLGIAVLNGLVLVSHFRTLAEEGRPIDEVVRLGALRRLRPVLMTASITALGLVPLLLARGPGSELQRPLAVVVIGGLLSSTALTLLLLPLLYRRFGRSSGEKDAAVEVSA